MAKTDITDLPDDTLIKMGSQLRTGALDDQVDTTLKFATPDLPALTKLLGKKFMAEASLARDAVNAMVGDRKLEREESRNKTLDQGAAVRKATRWRGRVLKWADILFLKGALPADSALRKITSPDKSLPNLRKEVQEKIKLLGGLKLAEEPAKVAKEISDLGVKVEKTVSEANALQEVGVKNLPPGTRTAWLAKGLLYVALKQINKAGEMVNEDDPKRAAEYNMKILYRNAGRKKKDEGGDEKK